MKDLEELNRSAFLFLESAMLIRRDMEEFNLRLSLASWLTLAEKADYYIDLFFKTTNYGKGKQERQLNLL